MYLYYDLFYNKIIFRAKNSPSIIVESEFLLYIQFSIYAASMVSAIISSISPTDIFLVMNVP